MLFGRVPREVQHLLEQRQVRLRVWVIGRLVAPKGISGALWRPEQPLHLSVEYDADVVNGAELLDPLQMYGLHARPARLEPAAAAA